MTWRLAALQEKEDLLREIHATEPYLRFDRENAVVEMQEIPFYSGGRLIRCLKDKDFLWYVKLPQKEIVALDGSTANIHHLNAEAGLILTEKTLPDYLKFRFYFGTPRRYLEDVRVFKGNLFYECSFYEDGNLFTATVKADPRGVIEIFEKKSQNARQPEKGCYFSQNSAT